MGRSMQELVTEFQEKYRHYKVSDGPSIPPEAVKALRYNLIAEEVQEELLPAIVQDDIEEIADGIADSIYVLVGCAISYGIPIDRIFLEVHRSNMTKTAVAESTPGQKYGVKTPKGPDYIAPDVRGILYNPERLTELERINS